MTTDELRRFAKSLYLAGKICSEVRLELVRAGYAEIASKIANSVYEEMEQQRGKNAHMPVLR